MITQILNDKVSLYTRPDKKSPVVAKLRCGEEVQIKTSLDESPFRSWHEIVLKNGTQGFISGGTQFRFYYPHVILDEFLDVFEKPSALAAVRKLQKGQQLYVFDPTRGEGQTWIQVRTMEGAEGFVHDKALLQEQKEESNLAESTQGKQRAAKSIVNILLRR
jgi:SH3-like domain-containing protein